MYIMKSHLIFFPSTLLMLLIKNQINLIDDYNEVGITICFFMILIHFGLDSLVAAQG